MSNEYQPKGSMCAVCLFWNEDCSNMDFKSMRPMKKENSVIIVKCDAFHRLEQKEIKE